MRLSKTLNRLRQSPTLPRILKEVNLPLVILLTAITLYALVYGRLSLEKHQNFGTFGFDLGIFDQGIWLLSQFESPFVTVRGLHLFGNHANLTLLGLVPFYWLGAGAGFLQVLNSLVLAVAAVPVWLIGRERIGDSWAAVAISVAYLMLPSIQWNSWWGFHPDALAVPLVLFAIWFAMKRRWTLFFFVTALALATKEDVSLLVFILGVHVAIWRNRWIGVATSFAALAWFFMVTKALIPSLTDGLGPFYQSLYANLGDSPLEILWSVLTEPSLVLDMLFEESRLQYYRHLFLPLALLPIASLPGAAATTLAIPHLFVNSISSHSLVYDFRYHYSLLINAALVVATIETCRRYSFRRKDTRYLAGLVVVAAFIANVLWSPSPLSDEYETGIWAMGQQREEAFAEAVETVPEQASVSATYSIVPHLTHRKQIYEFPVPWFSYNWGIAGEDLPNPSVVDWLIVDLRSGLSLESRRLIDELTGPDGTFNVIFEEDDLLVAERV